jgi:hypothetical protein
MIRKLLFAVLGIAFMFAGALAGLAIAMRWPFECLRTADHLCEPYASVALGPLIGFVVAGCVVGFVAKWYYRRRSASPRARTGGQAA